MSQRIRDVFNDVLSRFKAAQVSGRWRGVLAGLLILALASQTVAGPKLALRGLAAMAIATIIAGPLQLAALGVPGIKALRRLLKTPRFWLLVFASAVFSAGVTKPFSMVANTLPLGLLTPIMGSGLVLLTIIESLPGSRGLRRRMVIASPVLTAAGFAIFAILPAPGMSHIHIADLVLAGLAALSLTAFTIVQGMAVKLGTPNPAKPGSQDTVPGQLVFALANPVAGGLLLASLFVLPDGHPIGRIFQPGLLLVIAWWGFLWMALPTLLNMVARAGLPKGLYPALQLLSSPIGMLVQVFVQNKPASAGAWAANLLITFGSALVAIEIGDIRSRLANARVRRAERRLAAIGPDNMVQAKRDKVELAKVMARIGRNEADRKASLIEAQAALEAAQGRATAIEEGKAKVRAAEAELAAEMQQLRTAPKKAAKTNAAGTPPQATNG